MSALEILLLSIPAALLIALMKAFGEGGAGVFTTPTSVEGDVLDKYGVVVIGRTEEITERYYVISAERRIKHPAIAIITETARSSLFAHGRTAVQNDLGL